MFSPFLFRNIAKISKIIILKNYLFYNYFIGRGQNGVRYN